MPPTTDNPFSSRVSSDTSRGVSINLRPPGQRRFFYATSPTVTTRTANAARPLPPGCRMSKYGYVLRPGEVDYFEEEDKAEEARKKRQEQMAIRLAEQRELRARARDDTERRRLLDELYPVTSAGISQEERERRLENWRIRTFNIVVRFRCDPRLYNQYRHHYLLTERLLDPIHDRAELDNIRPIWVRGNKLDFLGRHLPDFKVASDKSALYRALARGLLALAGKNPFDFNFRGEGDIPDGSRDPTPKEMDDVTDTTGLDEAEVQRRSQILKDLAHDIGVWLRRKSGQCQRQGPVDLQEIALAQCGKKKKKKVNLRVTHFYSQMYYDERIKPTFKVRFAKEMADWRKAKHAADAKGVQCEKEKPCSLSVGNRVRDECWEKETPEFRDMVTRLHAEELEKQKNAASNLVTAEIPATPEQFDRLYATAALYLQPVCDAIATKFGAVVSILVCAPITEDGGDIGVFSAHAGTTQGFIKEKWPHADKENFRQVEKYMIEFGQKVFTPDERKARALPSEDDKSPKPSPQHDDDEPTRETDVNVDDEQHGEDEQDAAEDDEEDDDDEEAGEHEEYAGAEETAEHKTQADGEEDETAKDDDMAGEDEEEVNEHRDEVNEQQPEVNEQQPEVDEQQQEEEEAHEHQEDVSQDEVGSNGQSTGNTANAAAAAAATTTTYNDAADDAFHANKANEAEGMLVDHNNGEVHTPSPLTRAQDAHNQPLFLHVSSPAMASSPPASPPSRPYNTPDPSSLPSPLFPPSQPSPAPSFAHGHTHAISRTSSHAAPTQQVHPRGPSGQPSTSTGLSGQAARTSSYPTPVSNKTARQDTTKARSKPKKPTAPAAPKGPTTATSRDHGLVPQGMADHDHVNKVIEACSRGKTWGVPFADAVMSYFEFERAHQFPNKSTGRKVISEKGTRPAAYATWIKTGRPYTHVMDIGTVDSYRLKWWNWWSSHMPRGLMDPADFADVVAGLDDWEGLDTVFGKDGMLQFLLTLLWWGDALRADWEAACMDFSGILDALLATMGHKKQGSSKRKSVDVGTRPAKKAWQAPSPVNPRRTTRSTVAPTTASTSQRRRR
ncbi:hypothetical protein GGF50DRAFT_131834 [Schizophyllum commune]